jgi:hypothetical protein
VSIVSEELVIFVCPIGVRVVGAIVFLKMHKVMNISAFATVSVFFFSTEMSIITQPTIIYPERWLVTSQPTLLYCLLVFQ